jgi:hypothetical protein
MQLADLCRGLSREFPEADVDELVEEAVLEVDGVAMALEADDESAVGELTCFVDMGAVDSAYKAHVLERALAFNLSDESDTHGVMALDDEIGHLLLVSRIAWQAKTTVADLALDLRRLARLKSDFDHGLQALAPREDAPTAVELHLNFA